MSLTQAQACRHLPYGQAGVRAVSCDIVHRFLHIAALGSRADRGKLRFRLLFPAAQLFLQRKHRVFQIPVMKRLEQKIHRSQPKGRLRIGEAVIGREDDDIRVASRLAQLRDHLEPVHFRHFQVRDDERRPAFFRLRNALLAVGRLADDHAAKALPVRRQHDALPDHFFVFHDQDPHHSASLLLTGSLAVIQVPVSSVRLSRRRPKRSP